MARRNTAGGDRPSFAASDQLSALNKEAKPLAQELKELERQWQARKEVQEEAVQYQRAELARQYHDSVHAQIEGDLQALNAIVERLSMRGVLNDTKADAGQGQTGSTRSLRTLLVCAKNMPRTSPLWPPVCVRRRMRCIT